MLSLYKSEDYSKPTEDQIYGYYNDVYQGDINELKEIFKNGYPVNTIMEHEYNNKYKKNAAIAALSFINARSLNGVDFLLENGLDINYRDEENFSLLIAIMSKMVDGNFSEEVKLFEVKNKFELEDVIRLKMTFDKLMKMKPSLDYSSEPDFENIFDFAMKGGILHWFTPHKSSMNEIDKAVFETYRIATLFEDENYEF